MATQDTYPGTVHPPAEAPSRSTVERDERGIANCATAPSAGHGSEVLLRYRAAAVRADLLELATMLERANEPDPACMAALHELLSDGHESALYNPNSPVVKLHDSIEQVRAGLISRPHDATSRRLAPRDPR